MNIGERVLHLRKSELKISQEKFGSLIGLSKSAVSKIEKGIHGVPDSNIISICREYHVNEEWLRNGTGEMLRRDEDNLNYLFTKYGGRLNEEQIKILSYILKMDDRKKEALRDFMKDLLS